jgi:hypothetical protein
MFGIDRDNRQCPIPGIGVESRSGAAEVGSALTVSDPFGCRCLNICPCLRFQIPLIKLEVRISRVQLSDKGRSALAHGETQFHLRSSRLTSSVSAEVLKRC